MINFEAKKFLTHYNQTCGCQLIKTDNLRGGGGGGGGFNRFVVHQQLYRIICDDVYTVFYEIIYNLGGGGGVGVGCGGGGGVFWGRNCINFGGWGRGGNPRFYIGNSSLVRADLKSFYQRSSL